MKKDFQYYTKKIELLNFAELHANNPVIRKMWNMKAWDLFQKRTEWLEGKCQSFKRTKAE